MFPYLPGRRPVRMRRVQLWFEARPGDGVRNLDVEFVPGRGHPHRRHRDDAEDCCERYVLTCVASTDWPCLFHGTLDYPFPYLDDDCPVDIGDFLIPECAGEVNRAYLLCSYEAGEAERCMPEIPGCEPDCLTRC
jgi:hypothetical protein